MTVVRRGIRLLVVAGILLANAGRANADMCNLALDGGSSCGATFDSGYGPQPIFQRIAGQIVPSGKRKNDFLGLQPAGTATTEKGYNTDAAVQSGFNMIASQTHAIRLNDVSKTNIGGTDYREFFLDIQETTSAPRVSLDELKVFLGTDGIQTNYGSGKLNGVSPIYDLDNGIDRWIKLDISVNPAGTVGDMVAYIPDSLFTNPGSNPYVYLYSSFGANYSADGIFEEWSVNSPNPEPASLVLLGSGLVIAAGKLRRSKSRKGAGKGAVGPTKVAGNKDFQERLS